MEDQRKTRWRQVRGGAQLLKQCTASSVRAFYCSFGLQTLAWSKLPVLTRKKLAFKFSACIYFAYHPRLHYIHLASTWRHSHEECSHECCSSAPVYYCECKRKVKMGEAWERGLSYISWMFGMFAAIRNNIDVYRYDQSMNHISRK